MNEFTLKEEMDAAHRRKLFRAPSRAMNCRHLIWSAANKTDGPVAVADLVRDNREFASAEIYRAAKFLVTHGILTREDVSWAVIEKGSERTRWRIAIKLVVPFTNASRSWS